MRNVSTASLASDRPCVLVVDDDEPSRRVVAGYLGADCRVIEARSGFEALDRVARERCDLVLLDVMMPGLGGFDTCRLLKARHTDGFLPVLMITALHAQEERTRGLEAGADDFLVKPVDRAELSLRVRSFLTIRAQERQIRGQLEAQQRLQALKEDLVALLVHDVRTPLQNVMGHLQLIGCLNRRGDAQTLPDHVEQAIRSTRSVRRLLDDFLDIRLLEEGRLPVRAREVPLAPLLDRVVEAVGGIASVQGVALEAMVDAGLVACVDPDLVQRAIENVVTNAIRHTPSGKRVVLGGYEVSDGAVEVRVRDQGPGVPEPLRQQLFEKYRTDRRGGYGLGLFMVRLVLEAHEGSAEITAPPEGGACVHLRFPARRTS